ncbi:MAG: MFS transporter [Rhodocyclaceae bacterium]|nr:MFS transporter [Rhodocyclaceae bacterium]MBX3669735.1 MFS transporter [Rhodocyclaceae bacterium]
MLPYWRLSAYYFFYFAFVGAFAPYFSLYLASLKFSAWEIGVVSSLMQLMRIVAPNLWGAMADRSGRRAGIVRLSGALSVASFLLFFGAASFESVFVAMACLAFCWSAALPLMESMTFAHLRATPARYGSVRMWGSVGFIVAVLALGQVLDYAPPSSVLWASFATLIGIMICAFTVPEAQAAPDPALQPARFANLLRDRRIVALLLSCLLMSAAHGALYVFYSIYLDTHGYTRSAVGWLWTLGVVAEILVFWRMPALLERFNERNVLLASYACAVLRFVMIGWGIDHPVVVIAAQVLHGATFGAFHAAAVAAINRLFVGRHQARGQALYSSLSFGAGGMLGGLVSGWFWDRAGAPLTYTLSSVFALAAYVALARLWPRAQARLQRDSA